MIRVGARWPRPHVMLARSASALAGAVSFTTSYTDGGSWNRCTRQGFKASVAPTPDPGLAIDRHGVPRSLSILQVGNRRRGRPTSAWRSSTTSFVDLEHVHHGVAATDRPVDQHDRRHRVDRHRRADHVQFQRRAADLRRYDQEELGQQQLRRDLRQRGDRHGSGADCSLPCSFRLPSVDYTRRQNEIESDYGAARRTTFCRSATIIEHGPRGGDTSRRSTPPTPRARRRQFHRHVRSARRCWPATYNHDNRVDAADYTVWRDSLGEPISSRDDYTDLEDELSAQLSAGAGNRLAGEHDRARTGAALVLAIAGRDRLLAVGRRSRTRARWRTDVAADGGTSRRGMRVHDETH